MSEYCVHEGWGKCPYKQPKPTHAEQIRAMSDEELAEFLVRYDFEGLGVVGLLKWLKETD